MARDSRPSSWARSAGGSGSLMGSALTQRAPPLSAWPLPSRAPHSPWVGNAPAHVGGAAGVGAGGGRGGGGGGGRGEKGGEEEEPGRAGPRGSGAVEAPADDEPAKDAMDRPAPAAEEAGSADDGRSHREQHELAALD